MIYEYKDLKGVLKVGHKVRAVPGKYNDCARLSGDGSNIETITHIKDDGFWIGGCLHRFTWNGFLDLIGAKPTWETLRKGDKVKSQNGNEATLLARLEDVVLLSSLGDSDTTSSWYTLKELHKLDFTIVDPNPEPEVLELTVADVEAKFGKKVKIVKSK